jgi:glycosyltransferase involved in cell wall biosynthesis
MTVDARLVDSCQSETGIAPDSKASPASSLSRSRRGPAARPVRVLHVITRLNIGGPARHALAVATELRALGLAPMLVYGEEGPREGSFEDLIDTSRCDAVKVSGLGRRVRPRGDLRAFGQLARLMFAERPDVVHTHTAKAGTLGRLAAVAYNATRRPAERCVVIHTFHGHVFTGYFGGVTSGLVRLIERGMAAMTDRIVTVSARQKHDICQRYRIAPAAKTVVLEVGDDLEPLVRLENDTRLRDALGFAPHHVVFGYVGRFAPIKDLPTLVRGFARVAARVPDARLLLVGDGELRAATERLVDELAVGDRVRFTGWMRDLDAVYGALDVAVLASINEGTPLVLLEAMAAGRAVVATAVGGVEDIVEHDRTGILVPPRDDRALADAMERLAAAPEVRGQLGEAARCATIARLAHRRSASRLAALYGELLTERRA